MARESFVFDCACGKSWQVAYVKTPYGTRDSDSASCTCGNEIINWNGGHMYLVEETASSKSREVAGGPRFLHRAGEMSKPPASSRRKDLSRG